MRRIVDKLKWTRPIAAATLLWTATVCCATMAARAQETKPAAEQEEEKPKPSRNPFRQAQPAAPAAEPPADEPAEKPADAAPQAQPAPAPASPAAQAPSGPPLYERYPFDRIHLKPNLAPVGEEMKEVERLDLPGRQRPQNPRSSDKLKVRFLDDPTQEYEIRWGDIDRIELFEELVLQEAMALIAEGRAAEAFGHYQFLNGFAPDFPGVQEAVDGYLFRDAKEQAGAKRFDAALAVLYEVHARNPQYPGLQRALGVTVGKLIEGQAAKRNYLEARRLLAALVERYPDDPIAKQWTEKFAKQSDALLDKARKYAAARKMPEAQEAVTAAVRIWPSSVEARQLAVEQNKSYPVVAVGVTMLPAADSPTGKLRDWASLRSDRLLHRRLFELSSYDQNGEGGSYVCPFGEVERGDLGLRLNFRLRGDLPWSQGKGVLSGYDVSQRLLAMADPGSGLYQSDWQDLLGAVSVRKVNEVEVVLRRTHVRPDAMLQTALAPWQQPLSLEPDGRASNGPYVPYQRDEARLRYRHNPRYFALGQSQPREVEERLYPRGEAAVQALRNGEIAVLDRINPAYLTELAETPQIKVAPYAAPTVHCLLPNLKRPFVDQRTFRRALAYGIHREAILKQRLLNGRELEELRDCQTVTGPFPRGYAYNEKLTARDYDPWLSATLARVVQASLAKKRAAEAKAAAIESGADEKAAAQAAAAVSGAVPLPKLTLAHPPSELARMACEEIAGQLGRLELQVELREMPPGQAFQMPPDVDLLYVELPIWEPVVDARRLLGADGLVGWASPYMDLALRQLDEATDWKSARQRLLRIHQLAYEELTLIPLWQMTEFFAYRDDLRGVGMRPVTLYQNIESWQVPPWLPPDAK